MIKLSFILPFYGVERYIGKCLDSIYHQDIPEDEYEVICINDCSPDNSEQIVLQYAQEHTNLKLIKHDVNKKLGAARNTGLKAALGRYVWFIDTDDFIQENSLKYILDLCEADDIEILHFGIQDNYGNIIRRLVPTGVLTGIEEEAISKKQECIEITFPWNRIYKRSFLINNNLWFNDLYGGDVIHTILSVNICQRMKNVDEFFYFYRTDNFSSDTKSQQTAQKVFDMSYVLAQAIDRIIPQIKSQWQKDIAECVPWRINTSIKGVLRLTKEEQKKLWNMLQQNQSIYKFILVNGNAKTNIVLRSFYIMRMVSIIYKSLRNIKKKLK
mgnify:FL=1